MITTTQAWDEHFQNSSVCDIIMDVTLANTATLQLGNADIAMSSLSIDDCITDPSQVRPGTTVSVKLSFAIMNEDGRYNNMEFKDARILLRFGVGSDTIKKGLYFVDSAKFTPGVIEIVAYDSMSQDEVLDDGTVISGTAGGIVSGFYPLGNIFPNQDFAVTACTVGEELPKGTTKRDVLQYICELCGLYARFSSQYQFSNGTPYAQIFLNSIPVVDFTDDLDGGSFWADVDTADGGNFLAPISHNLIPTNFHMENQYEEEEEEGGETTVICDLTVNGASPYIVLHGFNNSVTAVLNVTDEFTLSEETYYLAGCDSDQYRFGLLNVDTQEVIYQNGEHVEFTGNGTYILQIEVYSGFNGRERIYPHISTINGMTWLPFEPYDGGMFVFWNSATNFGTIYEIDKIMQIPSASARKYIDGVRVEGANYETGEGDYEIVNNPFITTQEQAESVEWRVHTYVDGVSYHTADISWIADPKYEAGDIIKFTDTRGRTVITPCTSLTYNHGAISTISCAE